MSMSGAMCPDPDEKRPLGESRIVPTASVLVCRGCCCGRESPGSAAKRLHAMRTAARSLPKGRTTVTDCLGPCSDFDVVAVRHRDAGQAGRRLGTTWFRRVDDAAAERIASWVRAGATGGAPASLAAHVFDPHADGTLSVTPEHEITVSDRVADEEPDVPEAPAARRIAAATERALLRTLLSDPGVGWTVGVEGAVADVLLTAHDRSVTEDGHRLAAADHTGEIRLDCGVAHATWVLHNGPRPLSVVLATEQAPPGRPELSEVGGVDEAPGSAVFDLGVPGTRFSVVVDEPVLAERLRRHQGRQLSAVVREVGPHLVSASPDRVVSTPVARALVRTPIPPPGGSSPTGSHTHLLPDRLARRRPLPQQRSLPDGWWVGAVAFLDDAAPETVDVVRHWG